MVKQLKARKVFINPIYKDKATILKMSEDTGGAYSLGELEVFPGGGNFPHVHNAFEETFTAVKGILGVSLKGRKYFLRPGESITVPLNTPHYFFNSNDHSITCHVKFVPAHDDFVKGLSIGYGLAVDGKTNQQGVPKNITHLALLMVLTDTIAVGPIRLLFPLFKWLAKRARKNGTEKQLLNRYYYE